MKKKLLFGFMAVMLVAGTILAGCAAPAPEEAPTPAPAAPEVIKWKVQYLVTRQEPFGPYKHLPQVFHPMFSHQWGEWLNEITDGRLEIEILEPNSAFPSAEGLTAIGGGVIDAAVIQPGYWVGTMPEMYIAGGLPLAWDSIEEMHDAWYTYGIMERVQPLYDRHNVLFIPVLAMPQMNVFSTFDMPHPESLKDRKIRTWGQWGKYHEMLGATTVTMPMSDIYMALKLGTVEGAFTGAMGLESHKLKEVVTDFVDMPHACVDCLIINMDSLKALPEDIQYIIKTETPAHYAMYSMLYSQQMIVMGQMAATEYGLETWKWTIEEMADIRAEAIEKLWPEYEAKSPMCAEMVEIIKKQLRDLGKL